MSSDRKILRRFVALVKAKQDAHEEFVRKVDEWSANEDSGINPWEAASHYRKASDELQQHLRENADAIAAAAKAILEQPAPALPSPPAPSALLHNRGGIIQRDTQEPAEVEQWFMSCSDCGGSGYCTSGTGHWTASESLGSVPVVTPCSRCRGLGYLDYALPAKSKPGSALEPTPETNEHCAPN